jgi:hypothetical protein
MIDNEIRMRKSVDDSRLHFPETTVILDALRHSGNRHGLAPSDMPTPAAAAILAALRPADPVDDQTLAIRAAKVADACGIDASESDIREYLLDMRAAQQVGEGHTADHVVDTCAAQLRQVARIRDAERREADARDAVLADPTMQTRQAYADAIRATNAAHAEAPSRRRTLSDILAANARRRESLQGRDAIGIVTPTYPTLSNALCGWRGLILLAAMPGIGKTTLATAAAFDAIKDSDTCAVLVSFEMPTETLVDRTTAQMAGLSQRMLTLGNPNAEAKVERMLLKDWQLTNLRNAEDRLHKLSDRIDLVGKHDIGRLDDDGMRGCMAKVAQRIGELKQRSGASRAFVVIDHFGAIPVDPPNGGAWPSDTERARYLLDGLVSLRDWLGGDDPVVVIAQVRKSDNKQPDLASIMGTADNAYAADAVITFRYAADDADEPEQERDPTAAVEVIGSIVKGRDMMQRRDIAFTLDPTTSRIREGAK